MELQTVGIDVESAYGSDITSTSSLTMKKEQLSIAEPISKTEMCYQWLKYRIRHYMILEILFSIILILLLSNSYHISSQNEKTYELISNLQSQLNRIEKRVDSFHKAEKDYFKNQEEDLFKNFEISEQSTTPTINIAVSELTEMNKILEKTEPPPPIITNITDEKNQQLVIPSYQQSIPTSSTNCSIPNFNAANIIIGASIDKYRSSDSFPPESNGFFENYFSMASDKDQGGYVILERDELPSNKAWCTDEKKPILTVNLAKYINPTAVSYQHTKWNGSVPNGAPKVYDLVACLDSECKKIEPLVTNCEYKSSVESKQEQICTISPNQNVTTINKVQFHFRENYGNITTTCAYLVRVYGGLSDEQKSKAELQEDEEMCSELAYNYYNESSSYNSMEKNCTILYTKHCCTKCPECCRKCKMKDKNSNTIFVSVAFTIIALLFFLPLSIYALLVLIGGIGAAFYFIFLGIKKIYSR